MRIECDSCERMIDVPAEHKGAKITCPFCGDVNRIPQSAEPPASRPDDGLAQHDLPPKDDGERDVCIVRPAMFRAHPFRFLAITLLFIGGFSLAIWTQTSDRAAAWLVWPGLLIGLAGVAWWFAWWLATHWWIKLTVSNKRTVRHAGIIQRHTTEVLHDHVRSVDIQQSLMQRLLKVGMVGIDSAGQDDVEIVIRDIPDPYEVKKIIDRYRKM